VKHAAWIVKRKPCLKFISRQGWFVNSAILVFHNFTARTGRAACSIRAAICLFGYFCKRVACTVLTARRIWASAI